MKRIFWTAGLFLALGINVSWGQDAKPEETVPADTSAETSTVPSAVTETGTEYTYYETTPGFFDQLDINGYVNAGYFGNTHGSVFNGNANTGTESGGALNGAYISVGKSAENDGNGFEYGFKMDLAFGEDTRFMRVNSGLDEKWYTGHDRRRNDTYGFALPQAYLDVAMNNWLTRVGHFYTPLGYEGARADGRFFYSRSLSFDALPVVQTGVMSYYKGIEGLEIGFGWTNGLNEGFDHEDGGSLAMLSAKYNFSERTYIKYAVAAGDIFDTKNGNGERFQMYGQLHSLVLESKLTCRLTAATTLDWQKYGIDGKNENSERFVVGQHLYRQMNEYWKLGMRVEWQKDAEEVKADSEFTSLVFGANWRPTASENLVLRPEIRYDKSTQAIYGNKSEDQVALGMDVMFQF